MNDTYVFYRSFHEALAELDIKEYGKIMYAINEYALNQNEEKVNALTGILKSLWTLIKPQIDANLRRREYGKLGGRPAEKKPKVLENNTEKKPKVIFFDTEKKPNSNSNSNVNTNINTNSNSNATDTVTDTSTHTPSIEEVREYVKNNNLKISAEKFFNFYDKREWHNVTDWKLAALKWDSKEVQRQEKKSSEKNTDNNYCRDAKEVLAELEKQHYYFCKGILVLYATYFF